MLSTSSLFIIALLTVPAVLATNHTGCYNYYLDNDKCIHSAADEKRRCDPQVTSAQTFTEKSEAVKQKSRLQRRYDAGPPIFPIAGGDGICVARNGGPYDTYTMPGACVYSGIGDGSNITESGWLNGAKTSNCGKQLYVQRVLANGTTITVYVPVIDGCGFATTNFTIGCAQIYLTIKTFNDLLPSVEEQKAQKYTHLTWDFNNLFGNKSANAPV